MKKTTVLVTGSGGYIGSRLAPVLRKTGFSVREFDLKNKQDLNDEAALTRAFIGISAVVHLAAVGDVYAAARDPVGAYEAGIMGTARLVAAASRFPVKKIVYASTWEVYGPPVSHLLDETQPCRPEHPYAIAKLGGELVLRAATNPTPWIILRLGSAYGYRMRESAVIPAFIRNAQRGEPVILHGDGTQTRQFTHLDDICDAFVAAIRTRRKNEIFNIVSPETITIRDLAEQINRHLPLRVKRGRKRAADAPWAPVDSSRAKQLLGWEARRSLPVELPRLIREFDKTPQHGKV